MGLISGVNKFLVGLVYHHYISMEHIETSVRQRSHLQEFDYRCAIARCRLLLSAFPVSSWLLVGGELLYVVCGSHQACLMACLKDPGSDWRD